MKSHSKYKPSTSQSLHDACKNGDFDTVNILLDQGADPNKKDEMGNTPLHQVIYSRNPKILKLLIYNKAEINAQNNKRQTPLYFAVSAFQQDMARELLALGADPYILSENNERWPTFETPLHYIVRYPSKPNLEIIDSMQKAKVDVNVKNGKGATPLQLAAALFSEPEDNIIKIAEKLINAGAKVNEQDELQRTALGYAFRMRRYSLAEFLIAHEADITAEGVASQLLSSPKNLLEAISIFIKMGGDVNAKDYRENSLLQSTISQKQFLASEYLLQFKSVDLNNKNFDELTALGLTAKQKNWKFFEKLLNQGADPFDELDTNGMPQATVDLINSKRESKNMKLLWINLTIFNNTQKSSALIDTFNTSHADLNMLEVTKSFLF